VRTPGGRGGSNGGGQNAAHPRGIGDLRRYPPGSHAGILVLRPAAQDPDSILDLIKRLMRTHPLDDLRGCVVVVEPRKVRIRRPVTDDPS
jgi:hypothetical protein